MSTSRLGRRISEHHGRSFESHEDLESIGSVSSGSHRLKLKRLQSAKEGEGAWVCKSCGYRYPEPQPRARVRRQHKKICPGARSRLGAEGVDEAGTFATESSARQEEQPSKEVKNASRDDEKTEETAQLDAVDRDSVLVDSRERIQLPEEQTLITEEVPPASGQQSSEGVDYETLHPTRDRDGGEEVSSAAEQVPNEEVVESGQLSRENEPPPGASHAAGAGGGGLEEDGLPLGGGSRGTSVTEDYDSEYFDRYVRETEILSSDDGGRGNQEIAQSEDDEDYREVERSTTGEEEAATTEEGPGLGRRDALRSSVSEITLVEDSGGETSTAATSSPKTEQQEENFDVALILRKQSVFDIFCPVCGGDITRRIIARKKRRSFVSKEEGLRRREAILNATTPEAGEHQEQQSAEDGKRIPNSRSTEADDEGTTWLHKCLSFFYARFRTGFALQMMRDRPPRDVQEAS